MKTYLTLLLLALASSGMVSCVAPYDDDDDDDDDRRAVMSGGVAVDPYAGVHTETRVMRY